MDRRKTSEMEIIKSQDEIEKLNKMIKDSKDKTLDKEEQKKQLQQDTETLRRDIESQRSILDEKENALRMIREENKRSKEDVDILENKLQ